MTRASELREERDCYRSMYNQAISDLGKLSAAQRENEALTRQRDLAYKTRYYYRQILNNIAVIDPSIDRFRDEYGDWKVEDINRAAEWIRGHDAVHSFDQHDEAVAPVVFLFGGGDAA